MANLKAFVKATAVCVALVFCVAATANAQRVMNLSTEAKTKLFGSAEVKVVDLGTNSLQAIGEFLVNQPSRVVCLLAEDRWEEGDSLFVQQTFIGLQSKEERKLQTFVYRTSELSPAETARRVTTQNKIQTISDKTMVSESVVGAGEARKDTLVMSEGRLQDMTSEQFRAAREGRLTVINADRQRADGKKIRKTTVSVAAGASAGKKGVAPMIEANIGFETRNWLVGAGVGWTEAWYPRNAEYADDRYSMPYFQANAGFKVWKSQDFEDYLAVGLKGLLGYSQSDSDKASVYSHKWGFGGGFTIEGMWGVREGWRLGFNAAALIMPYNEDKAGQNLIKDLRGSVMFKIMRTF